MQNDAVFATYITVSSVLKKVDMLKNKLYFV